MKSQLVLSSYCLYKHPSCRDVKLDYVVKYSSEWKYRENNNNNNVFML